MTKIAAVNFSGNVGKSTLAKHMLVPRLGNCELLAVESINADEGSDSAVRGKQFGQLQEYLMTVDDAVVDVGASNVEDFVFLMRQYHGSFDDFDIFMIPTVKERKQQKDTMATIDSLAALGVPAKKIRVVFNMVAPDEKVEDVFAPLLAYAAQEKKCKADPGCTVLQNEVYELAKPLGKTLADVLADATDYRAELREAKDGAEKLRFARMISIKRLAMSANNNLDEAFRAFIK